MYLKIMSGENAPDGDTRKTFRMLADVTMVDFRRDPDGKALAACTFEAGPGETFSPSGNCYLLNDAGDTIASFGVAPYVPTRR
jgi:hypothetical protein